MGEQAARDRLRNFQEGHSRRQLRFLSRWLQKRAPIFADGSHALRRSPRCAATIATTESQHACLRNFLFERTVFSFSASGIQIHELTGTSGEEVERRLDLPDHLTAKPEKALQFGWKWDWAMPAIATSRLRPASSNG